MSRLLIEIITDRGTGKIPSVDRSRIGVVIMALLHPILQKTLWTLPRRKSAVTNIRISLAVR